MGCSSPCSSCAPSAACHSTLRRCGNIPHDLRLARDQPPWKRDRLMRSNNGVRGGGTSHVRSVLLETPDRKNPKFESRNPKQIRIGGKCSKGKKKPRLRFPPISRFFRSFEFVSNFGFRISDFSPHHSCRNARPGRAPVCAPLSMTTWPFTTTYSIPSGYWNGSS